LEAQRRPSRGARFLLENHNDRKKRSKRKGKRRGSPWEYHGPGGPVTPPAKVRVRGSFKVATLRKGKEMSKQEGGGQGVSHTYEIREGSDPSEEHKQTQRGGTAEGGGEK